MPNQSSDTPLSELEGYSDISKILADSALCDFNYVYSFLFREREDLSGTCWRDIDLELTDADQPRRMIGFRFHQVGQVEYSGFGQIMGLFIRNIKDRGFDGLRFEVGDYEDGRIQLLCKSITLYNPNKEGEQARYGDAEEAV